MWMWVGTNCKAKKSDLGGSVDSENMNHGPNESREEWRVVTRKKTSPKSSRK
jgi:hypothetical protein